MIEGNIGGMIEGKKGDKIKKEEENSDVAKGDRRARGGPVKHIYVIAGGITRGDSSTKGRDQLDLFILLIPKQFQQSKLG